MNIAGNEGVGRLVVISADWTLADPSPQFNYEPDSRAELEPIVWSKEGLEW